jgi:hypothetical protein
VSRSRPILSAALTAALLLLVASPGAAARAPAVGTDPGSVNLAAVPGGTRFGTGHAVPLKGARPAWFTSALERRVLAARGRPVMAPAQAPLPGTVGIRPGGWMISPAGCTMNFIFRRSTSLAVGTAGHCVHGPGDPVTLLTLAPGTEDPVLVNIGSVVLARDNGIGDDFALVSIRRALHSWVDPTIAVVGGPCGAYSGSGPETVAHYGHGLGVGTGGTPRAGVALTWRADAYGWDGAAMFGDSGSPVRVTGLEAAGNLTHLVVDSRWVPSFIAGTRIGKILRIASGWRLANSSVCV